MRKHTDWSCGHHTIHLSQCDPAPTRGCFTVFFSRGHCPASDVFRIRRVPCHECREREATIKRRRAERQVKREEMAASYRAFRASREGPHLGDSTTLVYETASSPETWKTVSTKGVRDVAMPGPERVNENAREATNGSGAAPTYSSLSGRPQVCRSSSEITVVDYWEPASFMNQPYDERFVHVPLD